MNSLIIVESPTKVKTIRKYLGPEYDVRASVGHVKDLPKNKLGIDPEKGFEPTYLVMDSKKKVIAELKKAASKAEQILLAPDPDREGEAIAWHIAEEIRQEKNQSGGSSSTTSPTIPFSTRLHTLRISTSTGTRRSRRGGSSTVSSATRSAPFSGTR